MMTASRAAHKIWIDLDNSPHVPFFVPIIRELEIRGHKVIVTSRDCFQVRGLADHHRLAHRQIGRHYGANKLMKVSGTVWRSLQLAPFIIGERPSLSISHGSRSLILLSALLKIPTILLFDYEHARVLPFVRPALGMAPLAIGDCHLSKRFKCGLRLYDGLKEDVYASSFVPDRSVLTSLGLTPTDIVVTLRPPATEAHYHHRDGETLFLEAVNFLANIPDVRLIILPRNDRAERAAISARWPDLCQTRRIIVPDGVVDGLSLIWHSDLVVSGGGTMNREAASLGVPVYSIFRGKMGAVDKYLAKQGRLVLLESSMDIRNKVTVVKRARRPPGPPRQSIALHQIVTVTEELLQKGVAASN